MSVGHRKERPAPGLTGFWLLTQTVGCAKCSSDGLDACECWRRCACGWLVVPGATCSNPNPTGCSIPPPEGRP